MSSATAVFVDKSLSLDAGRADQVTWAQDVLDNIQRDELVRALIASPDSQWQEHELLALLAEAQRRAGRDPQWRAAMTALNGALDFRSDRVAERAVAKTSEGTIRYRILRALAADPLRPSALARALGTANPVIARNLKVLTEQGLVASEQLDADRRGRRYRLTAAGAATNHSWQWPDQFDEADAPNIESQELIRREAVAHEIDAAVFGRRHHNALSEARERLEEAVTVAEGLTDRGLLLRAVVEATISARQADDAPAYTRGLRRLGDIAFRAGATKDPRLSVAAHAHWQYERGRGNRDTTAPERMMHLLAAAASFSAIADTTPESSIDSWHARSAWALFGVGELMRQQTEFGLALAVANLSARRFAATGDEYGEANSLFLAGFCLRLRGEFESAEMVLREAVARCERLGFLRLHTNALVQLGEARRASGDLDSAAVYLQEATEQAVVPDMAVTYAFANCHWGAVEYERNETARAAEHLANAELTFNKLKHRDGLALTLRRRAALARKDSPSDAKALASRARVRYSFVGSPAGEVACVVERCNADVEHGNRLAASDVHELSRLLDNREARDLIALDPWVPTSLHSLAGQVDLPELTEGVDMLQAPKTHHADAEWPYIQELVGVGARSDLAEVAATFPAQIASDMAGEPRRRSEFAGDQTLALLMAAT